MYNVRPVFLAYKVLFYRVKLYLQVVRCLQVVCLFICFPGVCETYLTSLQFSTASIYLWDTFYDFRGNVSFLDKRKTARYNLILSFS